MVTTRQLMIKGTGLAMLAGLLAAGCGGGSSTTKQNASASTGASATAGATTTAAGTATTAATATTTKSAGSATTTAGSSASSGTMSSAMVAAFNAAASGDCGKASAIGDSKLGSSSPSATSAIADVSKAMTTLSSSGPSELRADFATMAKTFNSAATLYQSLGFDDPAKLAAIAKDPAKQAQLAQAGAMFDDAAFKAASDRIGAWVNAKCPGLSK